VEVEARFEVEVVVEAAPEVEEPEVVAAPEVEEPEVEAAPEVGEPEVSSDSSDDEVDHVER
jgi:hypothetical protein